MIDIEKEIVVTINTKNVLIKPLVKEFISHIRGFKTRLYELLHGDRIKSLLRLITEVDYIIEEQIKAEKYHKDLIKSMEEENIDDLSPAEKFNHRVKLKYLKEGKTEDEIESFIRDMF